MLVFDDETLSRQLFQAKNSDFDDEAYSRHHFEAKNARF